LTERYISYIVFGVCYTNSRSHVNKVLQRYKEKAYTINHNLEAIQPKNLLTIWSAKTLP